MKMAVDEIVVRPGRREAEPGDVRELAESMETLGLLNPVTVSLNHVLIAGLHRLEAAKSLGWTEIECNVLNVDETRAQLAEIDENYIRCNLSALEKADLMKRRKTLYESLYPETKAGAAQAMGMNRAKGNNVSCTMQPTRKSFLDDTAEKLGVHRSTVVRMVQITENMTPEAREILKNTKTRNGTLLAISRMTPEQQTEAATLLAMGKIKSIKEYQATPPETATDKAGDEDADNVEDIAEFLAVFEKMTLNMRKEMKNFEKDRYRLVMTFVTPEEFSGMEKQADAVHAALKGLIEQVRQAMP